MGYGQKLAQAVSPCAAVPVCSGSGESGDRGRPTTVRQLPLQSRLNSARFIMGCRFAGKKPPVDCDFKDQRTMLSCLNAATSSRVSLRSLLNRFKAACIEGEQLIQVCRVRNAFMLEIARARSSLSALLEASAALAKAPLSFHGLCPGECIAQALSTCVTESQAVRPCDNCACSARQHCLQSLRHVCALHHSHVLRKSLPSPEPKNGRDPGLMLLSPATPSASFSSNVQRKTNSTNPLCTTSVLMHACHTEGSQRQLSATASTTRHRPLQHHHLLMQLPFQPHGTRLVDAGDPLVRRTSRSVWLVRARHVTQPLNARPRLIAHRASSGHHEGNH